MSKVWDWLLYNPQEPKTERGTDQNGADAPAPTAPTPPADQPPRKAASARPAPPEPDSVAGPDAAQDSAMYENREGGPDRAVYAYQDREMDEANEGYQVSDYVPAVEKALETAIPKSLPVSLYAAMSDALLSGGKRLRPALLLAVCHALGGDGRRALPFAVALECIHAYSLVHDDLPCMDDDDLRRGRPTCHKTHGEAMALLAGDGLLSLAQEMLIKSITGRSSQAAAHTLAKAALQMVGGQALDMTAAPALLSDREFYQLHAGKTGALFAAAAQAGAQLAGQSAEVCETLRAYGADIGLAFQITDDCLDVTGVEAVLGKATGADEDKPSFVARFGLHKAQTLADDFARRAAARLEDLGPAMLPLQQLALSIPARKK